MPIPAAQRSESQKEVKAPAKLHLYTVGTPNGYKASIILEELLLAYPDLAESKLSYDFFPLSFATNDQKDPEFLKINPNGRIPALVDDNVQGGHSVFESASILIWLVEVSPIRQTRRPETSADGAELRCRVQVLVHRPAA